MRILFVAYELEAQAMAVLAQRLQEDGHDVLVAQGDYYDFSDEWGVHQFFEERGFDAWVDCATEYERLYDDSWSVDWKYLHRFEEKYCVTKNIQQLLLTDPILGRHHHFRHPYYTPIQDSDLQYYWLELLLRWSEKLLETFDPDLVVTFRRNYLIKNVFSQFSAAVGLPMATIIRSRLGDKCHLVRNFGYGTSASIRKFLEADHEEKELQKALEHVDQFRRSGDGVGLYDARSQQRVRENQLYTTREILVNLKNKWTSFIRKSLFGKKERYRGILKGDHFDSHDLLKIFFSARRAINRVRYLCRNPFKEGLPDRPFVYMPLHTLPESSTLTLSTEYFERDLIRYIAKELPAHFAIAVKENPNMVGPRPYGYYEQIQEIPNVRLMDPAVPSKRLIRRSRGVVGISGTALLEAAVLRKPTLCFGHPEFESVLDYRGHSGLDEFLSACVAREGPRDPSKVVKYIQYILNYGRDVPLRDVRLSPGSEKFDHGLETIESMIRTEMAKVRTGAKSEAEFR
ncbi:capsular biosynthesis protein [Salinibacter ruber]|uniref:capsular biosynthesis protein n=2 Tax=Salinibacter ruber TaxID=146919 RepID=UPI002073F408|nr:capsular biosynthesis protein [Salinibacter ruber]MCS4181775.1 hypothetical protein [Salinibacter ruber]